MQETTHTTTAGQKILQEVFHAANEVALREAMDARLAELKVEGHVLSRRVPLDHYQGNRQERRRKRAEERRSNRKAVRKGLPVTGVLNLEIEPNNGKL
jgi:hypothetical protein